MAGIAASDADVVAMLMRQHGDIRNLFDEVERTAGDERRAAFRNLVRLLAVHETAEEEVIRPFTRTSVPDGAKVADERLAEEREAKELLSRLDGMDTDDAKFLPELQTLRLDVMKHARAEDAVRVQPHPPPRGPRPSGLHGHRPEGGRGNGPDPPPPRDRVGGQEHGPGAGRRPYLVDRTRDAVRRAMGKDG